MKYNSLKYLIAFIIPISAILSFKSEGILTFSTIILAFGIIPFFELLIKPSSSNIPESSIRNVKTDKLYSWILYIAVPVQIFCLMTFLDTVTNNSYSISELVGMTSAMGTMCGVFGINIAHELGHRSKRFEQFLAEVLLLTSLENHFLPYHNNGHHLNVGTKKDSATARLNESVFTFWIRSHFTGYFQAWKIENKRYQKKKSIVVHRMLWYTLCQLLLMITIYLLYSGFTLLLFLGAASFGILLLETVNYIEHYGLIRKLKENGKLERVLPEHSWNSDHLLGRSILFELSRHSDHHFLASKPYQLLESFTNSPQMPTGYPGMMLLSLLPPLWFSVMHKKLNRSI